MKHSQLLKAIPRLIDKRRACFLHGKPGVGKSDLIRQIGSNMGMEVRDVRLSMLDPVDLKGFPTISKDKKQMTWLPADFLPTEGKGILFLDELNNAPQAVQAPAYQLVLDRKLGDYELPPGWAVIAAGNYSSDRSIVHTMPAALSNRFVHLDFDVNADDWNDWAMVSGIHLDVRAFIRFRPNLLHHFDAASNPRAFPSPRSWAFVNDIYKDEHSPDVEFELIKGTVGEGAAAEFSGFTRLLKDLPTVDQVMLDPEGTQVPENPGAMYAISLAVEAKTEKGNIDKVMKYITRLPLEFQVLFMRAVLRRDKKLTATKAFMDWGLKNQGVLTGKD
jgi:hypothetical protein